MGRFGQLHAAVLSQLHGAELAALADQSGTLLQLCLVLRYELAHRLLHHELRSGAFGELVSIRCQRNCSRRSFAAIADQVPTVFRTLTHDIDLALWLSGSRVQSLTALEFRRGNDRIGSPGQHPAAGALTRPVLRTPPPDRNS